jgi:MFS family permease
MGALTDRVGRMLPIAAGFAIEGIAVLGFVYASSTLEFIGLRALQGLSMALLLPAVRALTVDLAPVDRRGQAFAWLIACYSGGLLFGPVIGGALVGPLGRGPLFSLAAVLDFVMVGITLVWLRGAGRPGQRAAAGERVPLVELLARPLVAAFTLAFGSRIIEGLFIGIWAIYLSDLGASDLQIGLSFSTFAIAFMLLTPLGGKLADRPRRWRTLLLANLALASLIIAYGSLRWVPGLLLLGLVEGALSTITMPTLDAYLASVTDERIQGRVQGAFLTVGTLGAAATALAGATLFGIDPLLPFLAGGLALALLTLVATPLIRQAEGALPPQLTTRVQEREALATA